MMNPTQPATQLRIHRIALIRLMPLLCMVLLANGCFMFSSRSLRIPVEYLNHPLAGSMADPGSRAEAYAEMFPALPKLQQRGGLVARSKWWPGQEHFQFFYLAVDDTHLRMRGFTPVSQIFDLIVSGDQMIVAVEQAKTVYQGAIGPEGSPFRLRYGVEPWYLIPVFTIGQNMALHYGELQSKRGGQRLVPDDPALFGGLQCVDLDPRTGLPIQAEFERDGRQWSVQYRGWDYYEDEAGHAYPSASSLLGRSDTPELPDLRYLMPSMVNIRGSDVPVIMDLEIERYQFHTPISNRMWELNTTYPPVYKTLEDLERDFRR